MIKWCKAYKASWGRKVKVCDSRWADLSLDNFFWLGQLFNIHPPYLITLGHSMLLLCLTHTFHAALPSAAPVSLLLYILSLHSIGRKPDMISNFHPSGMLHNGGRCPQKLSAPRHSAPCMFPTHLSDGSCMMADAWAVPRFHLKFKMKWIQIWIQPWIKVKYIQ